MRLTFVIASMGSGGAEKVMAAMTRHFVEKNHHVTLITLDDGTPPPFFPLHPAVVRLPLNVLGGSSNFVKGLANNAKRVKALKDALKTSNPDAIICFLLSMNILTVLAAAGLPAPLIISERDDPWHPTDSWLWRMLRLTLYPFASQVVVHTENARDYFPSWMRSKITAIPNPLMVPENASVKTNYEPSGQIVSIGRLVPQKGFDVLLHALTRVRERHPDVRLIILGEGEQRTALEALSAKLNLTSNVVFKGAVTTVFEELKNADVFVLASRFEGFGNVFCEAMALGVPVVSTDTAGAKAILNPGRDASLVPIDDDAALARALNDLLDNRHKRESFGQAARDNVKRFAPENIFPRWESLLNTVVAAK